MANQVYSVVITGANRGIGLQFVREFLALKPTPPTHIIGTTRDPAKSDELNKLAAANPSVKVLQLNVKEYASYAKFVSEVEKIVGEQGVTLLINNAGIYNREAVVSPEGLIDTFEVNTVAPLILTRAFLPLLKKSSANKQRTVVANITSKMGSIDDNTSGSHYAYRASKAALNMVTKSLSVDHKGDNIEFVAVHPGWVQTDMGGANALLTTEQSVSNMVRVLTTPGNELNGRFLNYDGAPIKW